MVLVQAGFITTPGFAELKADMERMLLEDSFSTPITYKKLIKDSLRVKLQIARISRTKYNLYPSAGLIQFYKDHPPMPDWIVKWQAEQFRKWRMSP